MFLKKAIANGEKVYNFHPNTFNSDIRDIRDWLFQDEEFLSVRARKLGNMTFNQLMSEVDKWHKSLEKKYERVIPFSDECPVYMDLGDYKWVWLKTDEEKDRESDAMSHCVGYGSYDQEMIFSLRDNNGVPHVTVEYSRYGVEQAKGYANDDVDDEDTKSYAKYHHLVTKLADQCEIDVEKYGLPMVINESGNVFFSSNTFEVKFDKVPLEVKSHYSTRVQLRCKEWNEINEKFNIKPFVELATIENVHFPHKSEKALLKSCEVKIHTSGKHMYSHDNYVNLDEIEDEQFRKIMIGEVMIHANKQVDMIKYNIRIMQIEAKALNYEYFQFRNLNDIAKQAQSLWNLACKELGYNDEYKASFMGKVLSTHYTNSNVPAIQSAIKQNRKIDIAGSKPAMFINDLIMASRQSEFPVFGPNGLTYYRL